jgi:uncharacterized repeat protein (TIGR02543 family)
VIHLKKKIRLTLILFILFFLVGCENFTNVTVPTDLPTNIPTDILTTEQEPSEVLTTIPVTEAPTTMIQTTIELTTAETITEAPTTIEPTTVIVVTTEEITTEMDALELQLRSIYQLAMEADAFDGTYEEWLETVRGPQGLPGEDGKSILLQVDGTLLQWQLEGDTSWQTLFDLSVLSGEDGVTPVIDINDDGYWVINGTVTNILAGTIDGTQYATVTFETNDGILPEGYQTTMDVLIGDSMTLPIPTKEGYIFKGWFTGETVNDGQFFNYIPIATDLTLYAKWMVDPGFNDDTLLNHFYFRVSNESLTSITIDVILGGNVETCGFDFKINYTASVLAYSTHSGFAPSMVYNVSEEGVIHFNYVNAASNIVDETIIASITFDIIATGQFTLEYDLIQIIVLESNGYDLTNTTGESTSLTDIID